MILKLKKNVGGNDIETEKNVGRNNIDSFETTPFWSFWSSYEGTVVEEKSVIYKISFNILIYFVTYQVHFLLGLNYILLHFKYLTALKGICSYNNM